jgi:2-haloacid dehalogenase
MYLVFDVNETLLDLSALDPVLDRVFGGDGPSGRRLREAWFAELLQRAMTTTITGPFVDFGELAASALRVTGQRYGHDLPFSEIETVLDAVRRLPAHDDVGPALDRLDTAGVPRAALSNGTPDTLAAQLENAGLTDRFDRVFSAQDAGRLKPAPEPYRYAARQLDVPPEDLCMVAAHAWDTTGALRAGLKAAFVARPGQYLATVEPEPMVVGSTLVEVVERVLSEGT